MPHVNTTTLTSGLVGGVVVRLRIAAACTVSQSTTWGPCGAPRAAPVAARCGVLLRAVMYCARTMRVEERPRASQCVPAMSHKGRSRR